LTESEDCLNLNIWAPPTSRLQKTAVLIWIYGGDFAFGSSNSSSYIGENLVKGHDDITVVSFNYRTNIFSSPSAPQLFDKPSNFALLDRDAAINWVYNNIENFGGDPDRITLFGESAGAESADAYTFSHPDSTLVKGIILESGLSGTADANLTDQTSEWHALAQSFGCGTAEDSAQLACMQAVPGRKLEDAVIANNFSFSVVTDGFTLFNDTVKRLKKGRFLKIPTLIGTNANEGDLFALLSNQPNTTFEEYSEQVTQAVFNCPAWYSASARAKAGVATFRYRYEAVFPNLSPIPELRAYHGSEVPIVFGTYNASTSNVTATADEIKLSSLVQSAWVTFARNPSKGLQKSPFNWPIYSASPNASTLAQIGGKQNPTGLHFTAPGQFDVNCTAILAQEGKNV